MVPRSELVHHAGTDNNTNTLPLDQLDLSLLSTGTSAGTDLNDSSHSSSHRGMRHSSRAHSTVPTGPTGDDLSVSLEQPLLSEVSVETGREEKGGQTGGIHIRPRHQGHQGGGSSSRLSGSQLYERMPVDPLDDFSLSDEDEGSEKLDHAHHHHRHRHEHDDSDDDHGNP